MEESCFQLRVQLSARGKRVVKGRYSEHARNPYGYGWHSYGEKMEYSSDQQHHNVKHLWFKITIPYGRNYDKKWLLNSIENECGFRFRAFEFHYINNMAAFFVDDFNTARSLVRASKRIQGEHYHKMRSMDTNGLRPLNTVDNLDHDALHIQTCLQKRYNPSLGSLDLSDLSNDPGYLFMNATSVHCCHLVEGKEYSVTSALSVVLGLAGRFVNVGLRSANVLLCFNNSSATDLVLQIISENFPQLSSLNLSHNQLSKLKGFAHLFYLTPQLQSLNLSYNKICHAKDLDLIHNLELRELWLEGNPLHETVENSSAYFRLITYHFPSIQKLDGLSFKQNLFFEQEEPKPLPHPKGSYFVNDEIKSFLKTFLHQYFTLYDSGERHSLLPLYHEHACCSFSLPSVLYPKLCFLQIKEYWKESRNLLKVRRPAMRRQLIKYNRLQVVGFLCNLPRTEHDLDSMTVDVSLQTTSLMCFTVEGKFKEVTVNLKNLFIPFRRTFIIAPASEVCAQILNDQMVINNSYLGLQETSSPKSPKSFLQISEAPAPTPTKEDSIIAFCKHTGMKHEWALKCLEDNNWDADQAREIFLLLKNRNVIPHEAFIGDELTADMSG